MPHASMRLAVALLAGAFALCLTSCASTRSGRELKTIQDKNGFFTKSLYYCGSTSSYHYFDQFTFLDEWWLADMVLPGQQGDGFRSYRVRRSDVILPRGAEFSRWSYKGTDDPRRRKMRIKSGDRNDASLAAHDRKETGERLNDALRKLDAAKIKARKLESGRIEFILES